MVLTYYAPDKKKHLVSHWYDVLIVLIPILRLTRLFALLGILEIEQISGLLSRFAGGASESSFIVRTFALLSKGVREARRFIVEHKFNYIFGTLVLIILFLGSIATVFESGHPQANIKTLGDGIWWSLVSVTTVGYGDRYPVTLAGRTVGVILMTLGVTAFSLLTANIASFLVGEKDEEEKRRVHRRLDEIEEKLDEIRKKLGNKK